MTKNINAELLEYLCRGDLLRAALFVGKIESPGFAVATGVDEIMEIASDVWQRGLKAKKDPIVKIACINHVLFELRAFQANSDQFKNLIDDPTRYYLHHILETKIANRLSFTILYAILAQQVGLQYECLALPTFYLLKIKDSTIDFYVDPFGGGKLLTEQEFHRRFRSSLQRGVLANGSLFERINTTQLVGKLIQQLKHVYILKAKALEALRAVEFLTAIFPETPELARDRGILYCEMEYFSRALKDLKLYLRKCPQASDVKEIKKLTSMIKGYREVMN